MLLPAQKGSGNSLHGSSPLHSAGCRGFLGRGRGSRPQGLRGALGSWCTFRPSCPCRASLPQPPTRHMEEQGCGAIPGHAAGWMAPSSSPSRPPPPGRDQKDLIPWASGPKNLSNHPPNGAVLSGRGPLFDFLPLWHAGGQAGWGPVCSKKPLWAAVSLSSPFFAFPWKRRAGGATPGTPRCSRGALTRTAHQKPSCSLPKLNGAALVIASALGQHSPACARCRW